MPVMTRMPVPRRTRYARASFIDERELVPLLLLLPLYGLAAMTQAHEFIVVVNVTGSCAVILILLFSCWRQLQQTPLAIWTPLVWFRLASAVYFGLGQLVPYVVNDATLVSLQEFDSFSDADILKLNIISDLGVICVLAGASIIGTGVRTTSSVRKPSADRNLNLALVFTFVGAILRYGLVVPYGFGYFEVIPGVVFTLAKLYSAGLLLFLFAGLRRGGIVLIVAIALTALDLLISTLLFYKVEVLSTLVFTMLAVWHHSPGFKKLAIASLAITATYVALVPLVLYGRDEVIARYGSPTAAVPLEERLAIVQDYFSPAEVRPEEATGGVQTSLARFSYVNVAARVVAWHDQGYIGDSLKNALIVFVPRIIWPEKPDISIIGTELYAALTGQTGSSVSAGLFAEAYWNLGWLGVPVTMLPYGILLGVLSRFSLAVTERGRWGFLPAVLGGLYIGFRVDGAYVIDIMGGGSIVLLFYAALFAPVFFLSEASKRRAVALARLGSGDPQHPAQWPRST
jgi:hypothetical protein